MNLGLKGRRAIVLGGSRGIGLATARLLREEGCHLAICARGAEGVEDAIGELTPAGQGTCFGAAADLADADATRAFTDQAIDTLGGLDLLIHNASGFGAGNDEDSWSRGFEVDVMAGVRAVDAALPALTESDAASITFVGSMASKFHFGRPPGAYGPLKAAMRVYANEIAQHHGKDGIRANVISPGAVWFPGGVWDQRKQADPKWFAGVERSIPLGRLGTAEEIARVIVFTASPAGLWLNAAHLAVDGGQVAAVD